MSYLLDTNVVSETIRTKPDRKVMKWLEQISGESLYISVLTIGEIRKGIEMIQDVKRKKKIQVWLEMDLSQWFRGRILNIDSAVVERWGRLLSQIKTGLPAIDSLIAATALHHDLYLVTRNVADFKVSGLEIINPWN